MQHQHPKNTFGGVSTSNLGPVVFLSALENSKEEKCFLIWGYKESFFFWLTVDISPLASQLTNIIHMLLIICEEHWPFLWLLLGLKTPATRLSSKELVPSR